MIELLLPDGERRLILGDDFAVEAAKLPTLRQVFNILRENGATQIAIPEVVRVRIGNGQAVFVMDEDALNHDLPTNEAASAIYNRSATWVTGSAAHHPIAGPVVLFTAPHRIGGDYDGHQPIARLPDHILARPGWKPDA